MKVVVGEKYRHNSCFAKIVEVMEIYKDRKLKNFVVYRQRAVQHTITLNAFKQQFIKVK